MATNESESPPTASEVSETNAVITSEMMDKLSEDAKYKQHPFGRTWQRFDLGAFTELLTNIQARGLDQEILIYKDMVLEGWHRYLACLATKTEPRFIQFVGTDLEAAEKVHASGVRRQSSADQRYAAFDLLCTECPEFKAKFEQMKQKGIDRKNAGIPLITDEQRVDVVGAKAQEAQVSRSTAAKIEKVKKLNPDALPDIAAGKTTANKVLNKIKSSNSPTLKFPPSQLPRKPPKDPTPLPPSDETRSVVVRVAAAMNAQMKDSLEEFGLKPKSSKEGELFVFKFEGTATDEENVLTAIADMLVAKGPVKLEVILT